MLFALTECHFRQLHAVPVALSPGGAYAMVNYLICAWLSTLREFALHLILWCRRTCTLLLSRHRKKYAGLTLLPFVRTMHSKQARRLRQGCLVRISGWRWLWRR